MEFHLSLDGHFAYLHLLILWLLLLMNTYAQLLGGHIVAIPLSMYLVKLLDLWKLCALTFWGTATWFSKAAALFYISFINKEDSSVSTSSPTLVINWPYQWVGASRKRWRFVFVCMKKKHVFLKAFETLDYCQQ
jgi:uncharacterized membrane protein